MQTSSLKLLQGDMKNKSWLAGGKYSKNVLYENGTWLNFWHFQAEETIKNLWNCSRISNSFVSKNNYFWWIIYHFLERNYRFDSFPGIFHVIDATFNILVIVFFLIFLQGSQDHIPITFLIIMLLHLHSWLCTFHKLAK